MTTTKPRGPIAAMYSSPGPAYQLPTLVGKPDHDPRSTKVVEPAYSFGVKHKADAEQTGPGPAYNPDPKFLRTGKDGNPSYSLYSRPKDLTSHRTPGPGNYVINKKEVTDMMRPKEPAFSFGLKTELRGSDANPGPNVYVLPRCVGKTIESDKKQAPAVTITGRSKIGSFHEDLQKTPGPGAYQQTSVNLTKQAMPKYSVIGRNEMPGDATKKPGPGAYSPENVRINKKQAGAFSFGTRHSQYSGTLITETDVSGE